MFKLNYDLITRGVWEDLKCILSLLFHTNGPIDDGWLNHGIPIDDGTDEFNIDLNVRQVARQILYVSNTKVFIVF